MDVSPGVALRVRGSAARRPLHGPCFDVRAVVPPRPVDADEPAKGGVALALADAGVGSQVVVKAHRERHAVAAFVLWPRGDGITPESFARIREGMSRAEVDTILGPEGDYTTRETIGYSGGPFIGDESNLSDETIPWRWWGSDSATIGVSFSEAGTVKLATLACPIGREQGPLDNLLWRAKRQWHRWFP